MRQLERCVKHQPEGIEPGPTIETPSEMYVSGPFIPLEDDTVGYVACDTSSVWGLRPPGEEAPPPLTHPLNSDEYGGDWA